MEPADSTDWRWWSPVGSCFATSLWLWAAVQTWRPDEQWKLIITPPGSRHLHVALWRTKYRALMDLRYGLSGAHAFAEGYRLYDNWDQMVEAALVS